MDIDNLHKQLIVALHAKAAAEEAAAAAAKPFDEALKAFESANAALLIAKNTAIAAKQKAAKAVEAVRDQIKALEYEEEEPLPEGITMARDPQYIFMGNQWYKSAVEWAIQNAPFLLKIDEQAAEVFFLKTAIENENKKYEIAPFLRADPCFPFWIQNRYKLQISDAKIKKLPLPESEPIKLVEVAPISEPVDVVEGEIRSIQRVSEGIALMWVCTLHINDEPSHEAGHPREIKIVANTDEHLLLEVACNLPLEYGQCINTNIPVKLSSAGRFVLDAVKTPDGEWIQRGEQVAYGDLWTMDTTSTKTNERPMWRCKINTRTQGEITANIFLNTDDPSKDTYHLFVAAGYGDDFHTELGHSHYPNDIPVRLKQIEGTDKYAGKKFWNIVAVQSPDGNWISDTSLSQASVEVLNTLTQADTPMSAPAESPTGMMHTKIESTGTDSVTQWIITPANNKLFVRREICDVRQLDLYSGVYDIEFRNRGDELHVVSLKVSDVPF